MIKGDMVPGAPLEARWLRAAPRRSLPARVLERIAGARFPHCRIIEIQPLDGGLRNANFQVRVDATPHPMVLRVYEHDGSLCQKEVDLLGLLRGSVPLPELIHAEPRGLKELPPFILMRF